MDQYDRPDCAEVDPRIDAEAASIRAAPLTAPQHDVVEAALGAVRRGLSLVVVTGDPGSGRSVVADHVAEALLGQGLRVDRGLPPDSRAPEALLARAASLLDLDPALLARAALPPAPVMVAAGFVPVVAMVVDDADAWPAGALRMLLDLARVRLVDRPLLHVILLGQAASLRPVLSAETLPAYASLRIVPLSLAQGREYLARHLAAISPAGASLSAPVADDILTRAGGNPGRIDTLVRSCLAAQLVSDIASPDTHAAGGTTPFRRSAVPAALLASMLVLGVAATALLPHSGTKPPLPDPARRPAQATSLPAVSDAAGSAPRPGCPRTQDTVTDGANGTARHTPLDPSCMPTPLVLAELHHPAPAPPVPLPAAPVGPLLLLHAPVAIGAERALSAATLGVPSLPGPVLPPFLDHLPVAAAVASTADTTASPELPLPPRPPAEIIPLPPRPPAEVTATPRGASGTAAPLGNGSVSVQTHPSRLSARPGASAPQTARISQPDHARPQVVDRRHDAPLEQPSPDIPADRGGIRDNPAGLVSRAGVPYFCTGIRPGNQAETDYIRQVCGR